MKATYKKSIPFIKDNEILRFKSTLRKKLEKRQFLTELTDEKVLFHYPVRKNVYHGSYEGSRTFRSGSFEFIKNSENDHQIVGKVDLSAQLTASIAIGAVLLIPVIFQDTTFAKLGFVFIAMVIGILIFIIGSKTHKNTLRYIVDESLTSDT